MSSIDFDLSNDGSSGLRARGSNITSGNDGTGSTSGTVVDGMENGLLSLGGGGSTTATATPLNGNSNGNGNVTTGTSKFAEGSVGVTTGLASSSSSPTGTQGTIAGVYLPCLQTILGVILFLRLSSITAQAGCLETTVIVLLCTASTFLTALSLSAIATNGTIAAGGPYYVISRTLGAEIGGAIGLLFYIGTTGSGAMYVMGAVELLNDTGSILDWMYYDEDLWIKKQIVMSFLLMLFITAVVTVGEQYVTMSSNFFLASVLLSVLAMIVGSVLFASGLYDGNLDPSDRVFMDNLWPNYEPDPLTMTTPTFFSLVSLFYPSVTGILAGSNRSAVLKDPGRSIPAGTLGAIATTTAIYLSTVWLLGTTVSNSVLKDDKMVVAAISLPAGTIIKFGIFMSCIGAALQCMAGAPRLLAAIALDDSMPILRFIAPPNATVEPRRAIWATWCLATLLTFAGNLDKITPIITMFFLLMYSGINLSCFMLDVLQIPGFRPTFRYFHWSTSLLGCLWCSILALVISWRTSLVTAVLFFMIYLYNKKQLMGETKDWGDVGNALRFNIVTHLLRALTDSSPGDFHAKNWRPQLLTLVDTDPLTGHPDQLQVLRLASQLNGRDAGTGGLNMVVSVLPTTHTRGGGSLDCYGADEARNSVKTALQQHMARERMTGGFAEVMVTESDRMAGEYPTEAVWSAVLHTGLGPLGANTVLLAWPVVLGSLTGEFSSTPTSVSRTAHEYVKTLRGISNLRKALLVFKGHREKYPCSTDLLPKSRGGGGAGIGAGRGSIDVWWVVHDGGLLLLLPYVLSNHPVWKNTPLRVFAVVTSSTENPRRLQRAVTEHLAQVRIRAQVMVVDMSHTDLAQDMRDVNSNATNQSQSSSGGLGGDSLAEGNTNHTTVGEIFSHEVYDIPYRQVEDLESVIGSELGHHLPTPNTLGEDGDDIAAGGGAGGELFRPATAQAFNAQLLQCSRGAGLVVTNLPLLPPPNTPATAFVRYINLLTAGIDNVLLIRGSGAEVITTYA